MEAWDYHEMWQSDFQDEFFSDWKTCKIITRSTPWYDLAPNLWSPSAKYPLIIKWSESRPTVNPVHIGERVARSLSVVSPVSHLNTIQYQYHNNSFCNLHETSPVSHLNIIQYQYHYNSFCNLHELLYIKSSSRHQFAQKCLYKIIHHTRCYYVSKIRRLCMWVRGETKILISM
jgi:hypothetical protein